MNDTTHRILRYSLLDSTMDEARRLIVSGCPDGAVILADRQTAGRGRIRGRAWEAEAGSSLLMTLIIGGCGAIAPALPLRVGLALCELAENIASVHDLDPKLFRIKWPNDLMGATLPQQWRKIAGILCEGTSGRTLAGIGLNLRPQTFAPEIDRKAGSLCEVLGIGAEALPGMETLAEELALRIDRVLEEANWRNRIESRLWMLHERVEFIEGHPETGAHRCGRIEGVDEDGRLILSGIDGTTKAYASGEINGLIPA